MQDVQIGKKFKLVDVVDFCVSPMLAVHGQQIGSFFIHAASATRAPTGIFIPSYYKTVENNAH